MIRHLPSPRNAILAVKAAIAITAFMVALAGVAYG